MITVFWTGNYAISDADCEKLYALLVKRNRSGLDTDVAYVCENVYNRIRLGIVEGDISHTDVRFEFENEYLHPNEYGQLERWPVGFCDYLDDLNERMILGMMRKFEEKSNGN